MIDPKVVELSVYNGIPHLFIPVVTDPKRSSRSIKLGCAGDDKPLQYIRRVWCP